LSGEVTFLTEAQVEELLRRSRRVAVLGIKPETQRERAAHYIPAYLAEVGYQLVPVPVGPCDAATILGFPVCRALRDAGPVEILSVFRRPEQVPAHLPEMLALKPEVVWFQSGLLHVEAARALAAAGIGLVHDCIGCRRAAIAPAALPLEGQLRRNR
jgi:uncharacterized protein